MPLEILLIVLILLVLGLIVVTVLQAQRLAACRLERAVLSQKEKLQSQELTQAQTQIQTLQTQKQQLQTATHQHEVTIASLNTSIHEQRIAMEQRFKDLHSARQLLQQEFQDLANAVFVESQKNITQHNKSSLDLILTPLQEQLSSFKQTVQEVYIEESKERTFLQHELKTLQQLNAQMSQDALNLTQALKSENKTQGSWGEMILERILEKSGLREGEEYRREVSLKNSEGSRYRPDVIVSLPNGRDIIIDAKTSLKDYEHYTNTHDEAALKRHIASVQKHIKTLAQKEYEGLEGVTSLDFILMFVPLSNALHLALEHHPSLYEEAFQQKVVLVSPQTLMLSLRTIENTWRYEKQAKNALEVIRLSQKLYQKVKSFVDDLDKVGDALNKAQNSYERAYSKLYTGRDNIIRQIEVFKAKANIDPKESLSPELLHRAQTQHQSQ